MSKVLAKFIGLGKALPKKVVTNEDLSKTMDTSDDWIRTRTGITERRVSSEEETTSYLAAEAAGRAISMAGISPEEIDLVIVGTTTPDTLFPSVACMLQDKLGAVKAACFDISAACSGFNFSLSIASSFIKDGTYKTILVVGADTLTKYVDWTDRSTCVLFGDGAGAAVLRASSDGSGILANHLISKGSDGKHLVMPGGGSKDPECKFGRFIKMEGKEVFKFAVRALEDTVTTVLKSAGLTIKDVDLLIPHQANIRIIDHAVKKLGLSTDKVYVNLGRYGNTSAASIPIALTEAEAAGRLKRGDIIVLSGFGAGLTAGANVIKW
jgi:3-oxoacyl-[acyl-carrier-protein] synthase-3